MKLGRESEIQDNFRVKQIHAADTQETLTQPSNLCGSQLCQKLWHILIQTPLRVKSVGIKTKLPGKHLTARWFGLMIQKRDEDCDIPLENRTIVCLKEFTNYLKHNSISKTKGFVARTG